MFEKQKFLMSANFKWVTYIQRSIGIVKQISLMPVKVISLWFESGIMNFEDTLVS